jgi:hypothetical protein
VQRRAPDISFLIPFSSVSLFVAGLLLSLMHSDLFSWEAGSSPVVHRTGGLTRQPCCIGTRVFGEFGPKIEMIAFALFHRACLKISLGIRFLYFAS